MSRGSTNQHDSDDGNTATSSVTALSTVTTTLKRSTTTSSMQRFQIRLHAANLPRVRATTTALIKGPPDVFCVVTSVESPEQIKATDWGTTEIIHKSHNPQWTKTVPLDYVVGSEKHFYVHVMRVLDRDISKRKTLGTALFEVGDILNTHSRTRAKRLRKGGCVFCHLESYRERSTALFRFQFACVGSNLAHGGGLLRQSSATQEMVLELAVARPSTVGTAWVTVFRSKPEPQNSDVTWSLAEIDLESAFQGSMMLPLRVTVLTVKRGGDTILGSVETSIRQLVNSFEENSRGQCGDLKILKPRGEKEVAKLRVKCAEVIGPNGTGSESSLLDDFSEGRSRAGSLADVCPSPMNQQQYRMESDNDIVLGLSSNSLSPSHRRMHSESTIDDENDVAPDPYAVDLASLPINLPSLTHRMPTFQDYIADGCEIDFCAAIDFTSSNGDPRIPGSLHHQSRVVFNDYEETITSIGNAVSSYSISKDFVVWGFGAKFNGIVRHLFQCGTATTVKGVDGILQAYQSVFKNDITMSGPTVFVQAIQAAACRAKSHHECMAGALRYTVLLIVTDGIMDDFPETKRRLALYSEMPLSIIFVGVGKADFRSMYALCSPEPGLRRNTTFVEFRRHQHDPTSLGKAALADIPSQLVSYMVQNGIFPIG